MTLFAAVEYATMKHSSNIVAGKAGMRAGF
jgi:hypothetical protein